MRRDRGIPLPDGLLLVQDGEGKHAQKPRNDRATALAGFVPPKHVVAQMLTWRDEGIGVLWLGAPIADLTTESDYIAGDALVLRLPGPVAESEATLKTE